MAERRPRKTTFSASMAEWSSISKPGEMSENRDIITEEAAREAYGDQGNSEPKVVSCEINGSKNEIPKDVVVLNAKVVCNTAAAKRIMRMLYQFTKEHEWRHFGTD